MPQSKTLPRLAVSNTLTVTTGLRSTLPRMSSHTGLFSPPPTALTWLMLMPNDSTVSMLFRKAKDTPSMMALMKCAFSEERLTP